ncbi:MULTISPECIES: phosphoribosylformylglycinamidine synthase subunit PurQ [unclassified Iodidimonas]|jgi:phosphoribosylformylglycinamidine synthase|uniref:phosphoribosylformylglycinamidine synthase subunit PurQ n=1 Tax=unclassified Iodidimonas TaxID=2626145 RepID=UPI0024827A32|nr:MULTISPECIES: phosphoribosylformylglycinamidine synthase subunit PurQ [unclassified Iodidimonas]
MKTAVITFPGSNCDRDMRVAIAAVTGQPPQAVWHGETSLPDVDFIALPGGFSYGDYLRCGAIAARSPIIPALIAAARRGVPILGVCNGFQILTEIGLLPGALMRNAGLNFICRDVHVRVETSQSAFTQTYEKGAVIRLPVAHHDGNYIIAPDDLALLEDRDRIAFRYASAAGEIDAHHGINGSVGNIAGILNEDRTILGMMPHPERMIEPAHGGTDGRPLFESVLGALANA